MNQASNGAASKSVRCAIYTRKSSEEGLNQEFNSLDAQREAAQAYIASQCHEGWLCLPHRYDDGGFTGANMDRPALQRLLDDIQAGKIDCVVVYKVDRLSRSLLDFARMMETFDQQRVAFVSVTQQFNTATSMGRLVLNVLLSFAQFEREIISERTRDKIAATRRKGKWSGGVPLLGYDLDLRKTRLVVNSREAVRVRAIFALYLELGGLLPVVRELKRRRWRTKRWRTRHGEVRGGRPFTKTNLHRLLTNVTYSGKVHQAVPAPAAAVRTQEQRRAFQCVGKRLTSTPISARITRAVLTSMPSISVRSTPRALNKGAKKLAGLRDPSCKKTEEEYATSGEIRGIGGMGFWWNEEVDKGRFVKLFLEGIKQAAGLSKAGMMVFEVVYNQVRNNPGKDKIELNYYLARKYGLEMPERTFRHGLRQLLEKEFIYESMVSDVFFVNIRYIFNGDRLAFVRTYHIKSATSQEELALDAPALALPAPEEI